MFISYYDYDIDFMFSIQSTKYILYIENFEKKYDNSKVFLVLR